MRPATNKSKEEFEKAKQTCPKSSYVAFSYCGNCGEGAVLTIRKGITVSDYEENNKSKCAYCGCLPSRGLLFS